MKTTLFFNQGFYQDIFELYSLVWFDLKLRLFLKQW